jgi:glycosyltransferase involved in cell wall biosynthesis
MTNQSPHLTIGITAYNGEKFIAMAIESVLTQNYDNFKIIISDDCSNDDTEKICRHYAEKDTRIEYIRQEINLGPWRNYVFLYRRAKTHSKYIKFLDQDDLLVGNSLIKTLINTLENGYDYVFANVIIRHSDKRGIHDEHNIMSCFKDCQSNYDMAKAASIEQSMCMALLR